MVAPDKAQLPIAQSAPIIDPTTAGLSAAAGPCASGPGAPVSARRRRLVTSAGIVEAWTDGDVVRASGLRYATAHRYAKPVAVRAAGAGEILDATRFAPQPPQLYDYANADMLGATERQLVESEDCHFLSITMPADLEPDTLHSGQHLPVMVWIHGGGYETGAADGAYFDTARLVAEQRVITVNVGYRLGLLGYLGGDGRVANLGLLDQIEALRWVRRHIESFGGDPSNITVFGESAGADAVMHLLAAHPDGELFDRAIIQSPPLGVTAGRSAMLKAMRDIARREPAGLPVWGGATAQNAPSAELVKALQQRIGQSVGGLVSRYGLKGAMCWGVEYGQYPMPAEEDRVAAWAKAHRIPVMVGATSQEASFFTHDMPGVREIRKVPRIGRRIYDSLVSKLTRSAFTDDVEGFARLWTRVGGDLTHYQLQWAPEGSAIGAGHAIDVALLFGTEERVRNADLLAGATWEQVESVGAQLRSIWADFARGHDVRTRGIDGVINFR